MRQTLSIDLYPMPERKLGIIPRWIDPKRLVKCLERHNEFRHAYVNKVGNMTVLDFHMGDWDDPVRKAMGTFRYEAEFENDLVPGKKTVLAMNGELGAKMITELLSEFGGFYKPTEEAPFAPVNPEAIQGRTPGSILWYELQKFMPAEAASQFVAAVESDPAALEHIGEAVSAYRESVCSSVPTPL